MMNIVGYVGAEGIEVRVGMEKYGRSCLTSLLKEKGVWQRAIIRITCGGEPRHLPQSYDPRPKAECG